MKASEITSSNFMPDTFQQTITVEANKPQSVSQADRVELSAAALADSMNVSPDALKAIQQAQRSNTEEKSKEQSLEEAVSLVQDYLDKNQRGVNFSLDDSTEKTVIKVMDTKNQELVKQFPSEELLRIANKIKELEQELSNKVGIFLDSEV